MYFGSFCEICAIVHKLCEQMRFEVDFWKSHNRVTLEALTIAVLFTAMPVAFFDQCIPLEDLLDILFSF